MQLYDYHLATSSLTYFLFLKGAEPTSPLTRVHLHESIRLFLLYAIDTEILV